MTEDAHPSTAIIIIAASLGFDSAKLTILCKSSFELSTITPLNIIIREKKKARLFDEPSA